MVAKHTLTDEVQLRGGLNPGLQCFARTSNKYSTTEPVPQWQQQTISAGWARGGPRLCCCAYRSSCWPRRRACCSSACSCCSTSRCCCCCASGCCTSCCCCCASCCCCSPTRCRCCCSCSRSSARKQVATEGSSMSPPTISARSSGRPTRTTCGGGARAVEGCRGREWGSGWEEPGGQAGKGHGIVTARGSGWQRCHGTGGELKAPDVCVST